MWAVESLKFCTLMSSFCPNHVEFQLKVQRSCLSWYWGVMQSLTKTDLWFQIWHEEFGEFSPNQSKIWKFHFDRLFLSILYKVWAKNIYRSYLWWHWIVMQNLKNPDLVISKTVRGIWWTFIRVLKRLKNCTLIGSFCPKHVMFQLENVIGIMCNDTEGWCKI